MKSESEIEQELNDVIKQINELQNRQNELLLLSDKAFLEKAKNNIGRCFYNKKNKIHVKIVDIPQYDNGYEMCDRLNHYQYPAVFVGRDDDYVYHGIVPFYADTIFSGIWGEGNLRDNPYIEITKEQFDEQFLNVIEEFKNRVLEH